MRRCLFLLLAVLAAQSAFGQKPEFVYDAGFEFYFDNREMDAGKEAFTRSMTINTAFLTCAPLRPPVRTMPTGDWRTRAFFAKSRSGIVSTSLSPKPS